MRLLATLRRARRSIIALVAAGVLATATASGSLAADPTFDPGLGTPHPPTCAERYPEEGPAGLDLRIGCIVGELVGLYTASAGREATPASTYALVIVGLLVAAALALWLFGRLISRAAGRRLAPVRPGEWWLCPACRSVNGAGVAHCYSCGAARPEDAGPTLRTDDTPAISQSFGRTRKRG